MHAVPSVGSVAGQPAVGGGQTPVVIDHAPPPHVPRSTPPHALFQSHARPSSEHGDPIAGSPSGHALHVGTNQLPPTHRAVTGHGDEYAHASAPLQSDPSTGSLGGQPGPVSTGGGVVSGGGGVVSGGGGDVSIGGGVESTGGDESSTGVESGADESTGGGVASPSSATAVAETLPPHAASAAAAAKTIAKRRARMETRLTWSA